MKLATGIEDSFAACGSELLIGNIPASRLAKEFGTPLFVYDQAILGRQWERLRAAVPNFAIYYSVKANPNLNILAFFLAQGAGLEIASAGELHLAREAGCPADRLLFAGPGKTPAEIELAIQQGVGEIHAESLLELERIASIGTRLNRRVPVAIRVNPGADVQGGAMRMGGKPAPFGIDEEQMELALQYAVSQFAIDFRGIHLFTGTQILDDEVLLAQYRKGFRVARQAAAITGHPIRSLDFGGGLGVPYFSGEEKLDLVRLASGIAELETEINHDPGFSGTRFIIEPGRYLVAEAGVYLTSVIDVKLSRGKKFVILDGGMNHHLAASGNLGQVIKKNFPMALANKWRCPDDELVEVVGPLCTPLDTLGRSVELPCPEPGDLLAIFQSGAYARTASPLGFLSHPSPPEVMVAGERAWLLRKRGAPADSFRDAECAETLAEAVRGYD
ncbi:MAG: type III PLP-dependent enzyme [Candidatus Korobacteraceae bacterium]